MFSFVGLLMTAYGVFTMGDAEMYHRSLGININIIWGIVLLVFGGLMLLMAMRAKGGDGPTGKK
jgi:uncharacterized membrane protein HdeD (DUF308 family)